MIKNGTLFSYFIAFLQLMKIHVHIDLSSRRYILKAEFLAGRLRNIKIIFHITVSILNFNYKGIVIMFIKNVNFLKYFLYY